MKGIIAFLIASTVTLPAQAWFLDEKVDPLTDAIVATAIVVQQTGFANAPKKRRGSFGPGRAMGRHLRGHPLAFCQVVWIHGAARN